MAVTASFMSAHINIDYIAIRCILINLLTYMTLYMEMLGYDGVIADLFRHANVPDGTHSLADMFRQNIACLLYTSPSPRDATLSRMPSSA